MRLLLFYPVLREDSFAFASRIRVCGEIPCLACSTLLPDKILVKW